MADEFLYRTLESQRGTMANLDAYQQFMTACAGATEVSQVWRAALEFFHRRNIAMVSYHATAGEDAPGRKQGIVEHGFPREWVCEYLDSNLRVIDPLPQLAAKLSRPFLWSQVRELADLSREETEYMNRRDASNVGDGLALQVYGPNGRNAYVGLGFGKAAPQFSTYDTFELQSAAQIAHLRYCELSKEAQRPVDLSPRELEVLRWMARGKSNSVIADILGISRHTVDTLGRRLFEKLEVNDRTTAAIRGLGSGLLHFRQRDLM